jgi:hypothetical protein
VTAGSEAKRDAVTHMHGEMPLTIAPLPHSRSPTDTGPMAPEKISLSPKWRSALEMLAHEGERGGATEAFMLARGFTAEMVASLALSGLAE